MTVTEAIDVIRQEGTIKAEGGNIRIHIAESAAAELRPAIEAIRREKQSALRLLGGQAIPAAEECASSGDLGDFLRGHALELWSETAGGRLFIVADEVDAARLQERRGETLTVSELEFVARIEDPALVAEVLRYKREFNGVLRPNTTP